MTRVEKIPVEIPAMSWIDRWIAWVDRRRLPAWVVYTLVFLAQGLLAAAPSWLDGSTPLGRFLRLHFLLAFWTVLPLALMHHLDRFAERALHNFRPVCDADEQEMGSLRRSLGTMPAGPVAAAGLAGAPFLWAIFLADPELLGPWHPAFSTVLPSPLESPLHDGSRLACGGGRPGVRQRTCLDLQESPRIQVELA